MQRIFNTLGQLLGIIIIISIFLGLPIGFMHIGAGHVEIQCIKKLVTNCVALEGNAFGLFPRKKQIKNVKKAKLKRGESYFNLYLVNDDESYLVNSYSGNSKIRKIRKLKKDINRFLKDESKLEFSAKRILWTPFFALGFLFFLFVVWFIIGTVHFSVRFKRNKQQLIYLMNKPDPKTLIRNLDQFLLIPHLSIRSLSFIVFLSALIGSLLLINDILVLKNFDEVTILWIVFLGFTFKLGFWLKKCN